MSHGMHGLRLIDQLCETVGRVMMIQSGYLLLGRIFDHKTVAFLVAGLHPKEGGIFGNIVDLVTVHINEGKKVLILLSGMADTDVSHIVTLFENPSVTFCVAKGEMLSARVQTILDTLYKAAPCRLYPFISHHDVVSCAAVQKGLAGEIVMGYVYDHVSTLGLSNSSIDKIIFRSTSHINAVAGMLPGKKFLLIPSLFQAKFTTNPYKPFRNGTLTTACAAARPYKVERVSEFEYCEVIADVIRMTNGQHIHYGPLTESYMARMTECLKVRDVDPNKFIHIPYTENFSATLNAAGIDLFFTPFPVGAGTTAIEIMSCGIPMIYYRGNGLNTIGEINFCDSYQWSWSTPEEIFAAIESATADELLRKSLSAHKYFEIHFDFFNNQQRILQLSEKDIHINDAPLFKLTDIIDNELYEIDDFKMMLLQGLAVM